MSCMTVYDILGLHKVLGGVDRARLKETCPHRYQIRAAGRQVNNRLYDYMICMTCGKKFWVRICHYSPTPDDQELFIPLDLPGRFIQKEGA